jgi:hypothetical protein
LKFNHPQRRFTNAGAQGREPGSQGSSNCDNPQVASKLTKILQSGEPTSAEPSNKIGSQADRQTDRQKLSQFSITLKNQPQVLLLDDDGSSSNCRWPIPSSDIF